MGPCMVYSLGMQALYECKQKFSGSIVPLCEKIYIYIYTNSSNALYVININEVRGVNHEICHCHDIFTNASSYAL